MKLRYALPLLAVVALGGCKDFLQEKPQDFFSPDNFPASEADLNIALGGIQSYYTTGGSQPYYQRGWYILSEEPSDMTVDNSTSNTRHDVESFTMTSENEWLWRFWQPAYGAINAANMLIQRIPSMDIPQSVKDEYLGAAEFHRALNYFNLVRVFGGVPLLTEPVDGFGSLKDVKRASVQDVYAQISQDLEDAAQKLPASWPEGMGKPTVGAANAMLADVYLNMSGALVQEDHWADAAAAAKRVIDEGVYRLNPDFAALWHPSANDDPEFVYSITFAGQKQNTMAAQSHPGGIGSEAGWNYWYTTTPVMDRFSDQDARKAATFKTSVTVGDKTYSYTDFGDHSPRFAEPTPYLAKWWDSGYASLSENSKRSDQNVPVYRYAGVLLMYAEALNEANGGPTPEAYDAIDQVRARAHLDPLTPGLDQAGFRQAIKDERYHELAFESKRYFDLKRWGDWYNVLKDDPVASEGITPEKVYFPIPQREIDLMPGLEQNPGW